jgi:hypothetical protein
MADTPEIQAAADRIARDLVAYALGDIRDLLGTDCISEAIDDDKAASQLDGQAEGQIFGLVWDRLGRAATDYQRPGGLT